MSKVRNLTEITVLDSSDLLYAVDYSEGTNGGRRITLGNLKTSLGIDILKRGFIQYSNASLQTNSTTTYTDLTASTNQSSYPNSLFTKTSSTQFRCDFNGYVRMSYKVNGYVDTNDRGLGIRISKNGTSQSHTVGQIWGKNQEQRSGSCSGSFIFQCAVNDYFTVQYAALEGGVTVTVPINGLSVILESYLVQ